MCARTLIYTTSGTVECIVIPTASNNTQPRSTNIHMPIVWANPTTNCDHTCQHKGPWGTPPTQQPGQTGDHSPKNTNTSTAAMYSNRTQPTNCACNGHTHIHACIHPCSNPPIHQYIHTIVYRCIHIVEQIDRQAGIQGGMLTSIRPPIHTYSHTYISAHKHTHTEIYIPTYTYTHMHTYI